MGAPEWTKVLKKNPDGERVLGLGTLQCLEMSPDGRLLATGGSVGVVLWDIRGRRVIARHARKVAPVVGLTFSLDGKRLAALGRSGAIALCDLQGSDAPKVVRLPDSDDEGFDAESAPRMAFSTDGTSLLVMGEEQAWLVQDGRARRLSGEGGALGEEATVAGFSADGDIVVLENEATAFYRVVAGKKRPARTREIPFRGGSDPIAVSGDGRFLLAPVAGADESSFAIVSLETGDVLATPRFEDSVFGIRFAWRSPAVLVDVYKGPRVVTFPERAGDDARVLPNRGRLRAVGVSDHWVIGPGGDLVAAGDSYGGDIVFRHLEGGEAPAPLGRYIYDSDSAVALAAVDARGERGVIVGFIGDGQNSSAWAQGWDLAEDRPGPVLSKDVALFCNGVVRVPGTPIVVLPLDGKGLLLADETTGASTALKHDDGFQGAAVSPDGTVVAGGTVNGDLVLWDRASGRQIACVSAHRDQICAVSWQPRGDLVATSSQDGTVRLWSAQALIAEGKPRGKQEADRALPPGNPVTVVKVGDMLYEIAFSADGALGAVGAADGSACVFRAGTGEIVSRLEGHSAEVMALAFHPRTGELVTGSNDGTLKVWDVETGTALLELSYQREEDEELPAGGVISIEFDAEGTALFTSHVEGTIRRWGLPASDGGGGAKAGSRGKAARDRARK